MGTINKFLLRIFLLSLVTITLSVSPSVAQIGCTKQDMKNIRSFDRKAKRVIKKIKELNEEARKERNPRINDDVSDQMDELEDFFSSPEYEAMKPVYERCNKPIPKMYGGYKPFWIPTN